MNLVFISWVFSDSRYNSGVAYAALQNMPLFEDRIPSLDPDNKMKIFLENFRTVALGRVIGRGPMSLARFFLNRESVSERLLGMRQPCCRFRRDSPAVRLFVGGRSDERKVAFSLSGKTVSEACSQQGCFAESGSRAAAVQGAFGQGRRLIIAPMNQKSDSTNR
jgi:hypothetical protein